MTLHTAYIASRLKRFLDRRQPPRRIEGKPQAETDEVQAMVGAVARYAPHGPDGLATWWPKFEAALGEAGTGLWPTEREIRDAAAVANRDRPKLRSDGPAFDPHEISARRMAAGEPVGENFLYGREAVEMIRRHLVDEPTMTRYRSGAFFSRKDMHGEASALAWEAEAKARHEAAKLMLRDPERHPHRTVVPDLHMPVAGGF